MLINLGTEGFLNKTPPNPESTPCNSCTKLDKINSKDPTEKTRPHFKMDLMTKFVFSQSSCCPLDIYKITSP